MSQPLIQRRALPSPFGRYRIIKMIGEGGMGAVYLARDSQLDRDVAIKIPQFAANEEASLRERFFQEARAAATVQHPNICPIFDVGEIEGIHYLTMSFIDGKPLEVWAGGEKSLTCRQIAVLIRKVAAAMHEAHKKGVIHRDLKPANIMIDRRGEPIVMDFGLARRVERNDQRLTQSGAIMGSPAYMAPEQVRGEIDVVGPASDIYCLGVILYELLTHRVPFIGTDNMAVLAQVLLDEPAKPSLLRLDLDAALEQICLKAMAKKIEDRYASMADLAGALQSYLRGSTKSGESQVSVNTPAQGLTPVVAPPSGFQVSRIGGLRSLAQIHADLGAPRSVVERPRRARRHRREKFRGRPAMLWIVGGAGLLVPLVGLIIFGLQLGRDARRENSSDGGADSVLLSSRKTAAPGRVEPKQQPAGPTIQSPKAKVPPVADKTADSSRPDRNRKKVVETDYEYTWRGERRKTRQLIIDLGGNEHLELVRISNGSFQMGTTVRDVKSLARFFSLNVDEYIDESPRHTVTITREFYLSKTHVSVGQFRRFVMATGYKTKAEEGAGAYGADDQGNWSKHKECTWQNPGFLQTDRYPVVCVNWNDAKNFLDWLRSEYGVAAFLPTEAQYEYANRAGTGTRYFTGDDVESLRGYANLADASLKRTKPNWLRPTIQLDDGYAFTSPVASYKPNPFGLYDMTGNAWVWCQDWYDASFYSNSPDGDPVQNTGQRIRVLRGGSWNDKPERCRSAVRGSHQPEESTTDHGIRISVSSD
jgi:formylglycine-generating enzyme required for sulfatase activity/serine/threonine protein kinase